MKDLIPAMFDCRLLMGTTSVRITEQYTVAQHTARLPFVVVCLNFKGCPYISKWVLATDLWLSARQLHHHFWLSSSFFHCPGWTDQTLSLNFAGELKKALLVILRRAVGEWLLADNAGYHTAGVCKASGKLLVPNKVKPSMCEESLSLSLKDNVWQTTIISHTGH